VTILTDIKGSNKVQGYNDKS